MTLPNGSRRPLWTFDAAGGVMPEVGEDGSAHRAGRLDLKGFFPATLWSGTSVWVRLSSALVCPGRIAVTQSRPGPRATRPGAGPDPELGTARPGTVRA